MDAEGWNAALQAFNAAYPPAYQQFGAYGEIARAGGRRVARLVLSLKEERIALAQVIGRRGLWWLGRGPVFAKGVSEADRARALRALARRFAPGLFIATPEAPVAGRGLIPIVTARHQALWALGPDVANLRSSLDGKWRNRLASAERKGMRITLEEDPAWLLDAEHQQRKKRGYKALPRDFTTAWEMAMPGSVLSLGVQSDAGERLAGVVMMCHGRSATYQLGWSGEEGRKTGAHNFLLWQVSIALRAQGIRYIDLGDINSEEGAGLMRFKLGTGASVHRLGATMLVLPI
ncbi:MULTISPECIES: GNAT family N-acetyltransferase [Thioclava]|uniref:GNAT family N-acetyltransferase n=1 Tax=Thioclava kandeliae TaxID=3070818 RepID=A0ABV1SI83_9RHOB